MTTGKSTKKIATPKNKQIVFTIEHRVLLNEISDISDTLEALSSYGRDTKIVDARVEEIKDA